MPAPVKAGNEVDDSELLALLAAIAVTPSVPQIDAAPALSPDTFAATPSAAPLKQGSSADLACTALLSQLSTLGAKPADSIEALLNAPTPSADAPVQADVALPLGVAGITESVPTAIAASIQTTTTPQPANPNADAIQLAPLAPAPAQVQVATADRKPAIRAAMPSATPPAAVQENPAATPLATTGASIIPSAEIVREIRPAHRADQADDNVLLPLAEQSDEPANSLTPIATPAPLVSAPISAPITVTPSAAPSASALPAATAASAENVTRLPTVDANPTVKASTLKTGGRELPAVSETTQSSTAAPTTTATTPRVEPPSLPQRSEATAPAAPHSEANQLDRAVAHQVSRAIVQHLPDGGTRMVMRLTPPELGTVRVEFISRDGMMTARLMAEDEGVRQALDRALPHIRAEVRSDQPSLNITVERGDQRQAWSEGHARQEQRGDQRPNQGRRPRDDEPVFSIDGVEAAPAPTPFRTAPVLGGRVTNATVDALA